MNQPIFHCSFHNFKFNKKKNHKIMDFINSLPKLSKNG